MLTLEQATAGPWTLVTKYATDTRTVRVTRCEADPRLAWYVAIPRRRRGPWCGMHPNSRFVVGGAPSDYQTLAAAVAALNALDGEIAHG